MSDVFRGQTVLVTGAASGIGRATALMLRARGAALVLFDQAPAAQSLVGLEGEEVSAFSLDVSDEDAVGAAVAASGPIDALVHAAGIFRSAPLTNTTLADFDQVIRVNLTGTFLIVREVVRAMRAHGKGGRIVALSSELAALGRAEHAAYCASKAAISAMTRCWARELGPDILVNAVAPGPTDTPLLDWANIEDRWRAAELGNPLGRIGQPDEIASAICFLLGPGGGFITGQTIGVNGGAAMS